MSKKKDKELQRELDKIAEFMHNKYEEASYQVGWKTQKNCRVPFKDLPLKNKAVMRIVAHKVYGYITRRILLGLDKHIKEIMEDDNKEAGEDE